MKLQFATQLKCDNATKQNESLNTMLHKKKEEYEQQMIRNEELAGQNSIQMAELSKKEDDIFRLKQEIGRVNKLCDGIKRKLRTVEEQKAETEAQRDSLKQQILSLEKGNMLQNHTHYSKLFYILLDIEQQRKKAELDRKTIEDLVRERDALSKVST